MLGHFADKGFWEDRLLMVILWLPVDDDETENGACSPQNKEKRGIEGSFEHANINEGILYLSPDQLCDFIE